MPHRVWEKTNKMSLMAHFGRSAPSQESQDRRRLERSNPVQARQHDLTSRCYLVVSRALPAAHIEEPIDDRPTMATLKRFDQVQTTGRISVPAGVAAIR